MVCLNLCYLNIIYFELKWFLLMRIYVIEINFIIYKKDEDKFIRCFIFLFWVKGVWYWLVLGIIVINGVLFSVLFFMVLVGF